MKKHNERIILGLLLFAFVLILYPFGVNAVWGDGGNFGNVKCPYLDENGSFLSAKYGIKLSYNQKQDVLNLKINSNNYRESLREIIDQISFRVEDIAVFDVSNLENDDDPGVLKLEYTAEKDAFVMANVFGIDVNTARLTNTQGISIRTYKGAGQSLLRYEIVLIPDGFSDPEVKEKCPDVENFYIKLSLELAPKTEPIVVSHQDEIANPEVGPKIDCKNPKEGFEQNYCNLKNAFDNAKKAGKPVVDITIDKNYTGEPTYEGYKKSKNAREVYTCDPFQFITDPDEAKTDEGYYKNANYLHASIIKEVSGQYVYHYQGKDYKDYKCDATTVDASCKVRCDEYVSVEYGPPVASKSGLCFEYKVKVTSRVNCDLEEPPKPPAATWKVCDPTPACWHTSRGGWWGKAAGPSEDFDACIDTCDGGRYTTSCSVACYNQVYGKLNRAKVLPSEFTDSFPIVADQMASYRNNTVDRDTSCDYQGFYTCNGKKEDSEELNRIWISDCANEYSGLARVYTKWNFKHLCVKTIDEGGGISSVCGCSAKCEWNGCTEPGEYVNEDQGEEDYKANKKVYDHLVENCSNYVKCSTTQSEFTMSVDYDHKGKTTTINFPYGDEDAKSKSANISFDDNTSTSTCTPSDSNSIFLKTNGCYNCDKSTKIESGNSSVKWYMAEWTFPGTWANLKNQDQISYKPKEGYYLLKKNKFCLPKQTDDVNQKWWNYYFVKEQKDNGFKYSCDPKQVDFTNDDINDLNYNIRANATHFGMFEWNIGIKCFYATNSGFGDKDSAVDPTTCPPLKPNAEPVSARAADLQNLFPDLEGGTGSNGTSREPGFNWTSYAASDKDPNYVSDPEAYRSFVESINYRIYDENYLDYYIILTKDDIKTLRNINAKSKEFNKSILGEDDITNLVHYRSDLFRHTDTGNGPILKNSGNLIPNEFSLKCNNILSRNEENFCFNVNNAVEDKLYE